MCGWLVAWLLGVEIRRARVVWRATRGSHFEIIEPPKPMPYLCLYTQTTRPKLTHVTILPPRHHRYETQHLKIYALSIAIHKFGIVGILPVSSFLALSLKARKPPMNTNITISQRKHTNFSRVNDFIARTHSVRVKIPFSNQRPNVSRLRTDFSITDPTLPGLITTFQSRTRCFQA